MERVFVPPGLSSPGTRVRHPSSSSQAAERVHRDARRAERFHVPVHGTRRHLETLRELAARKPAVALQEQEG